MLYMYPGEFCACVSLDAEEIMLDILDESRRSGYQAVYLAFRQHYTGPDSIIIERELNRKAHRLEDYLDKF